MHFYVPRLHNGIVLLGDMVSLELILVSGGIFMLLLGGTFFAVAALIGGIIKRRKSRNAETSDGEPGRNR